MESADAFQLLITRLIKAELEADKNLRKLADAKLIIEDMTSNRDGKQKLAILYETTAELTRLLSLPRHGANRDAIAKQANTVNKALRDAYDHCWQLQF